MFLKKIILHGFKSFADRTEFEFGPGMTGIVGPNGCGKSNVSDAIRWVLGEQSAKSLRGARMLDVIFSGSRSRKPGNCAEVELVFDNASRVLTPDQDDVSVSRLLYRSGESEYRVNGKTSRLKDIRDLLLDTGVGADAYCIIEQGRVDAMLQADPQQRREIFEEAAGISRYRVRRVEAQRRLERTQNNLLRVNDLVEELERRLRSVKLAAGKARSYQECDARLRELRSAHALAEYRQHSQDIRALRLGVEAHGAVAAACRAGLAQRGAIEEAIQCDLIELEAPLHREEETLHRCGAELLTLQERIASGLRRLEDLAAVRERQIARAAEARREAEEIEARLAEERAALGELREVERRESERAAELADRRGAAQGRVGETRVKLEQQRRATFETVRTASLLQNQLANLQQQRERSEQRVGALAERRAALDRERDEAAQHADELDARLADAESNSSSLAGQTLTLEQRISSLRDEIEQAAHDVATLKESRGGLLSRLNLLEDLERRLEGVDQGTRGVLAWRDDAGRDGGVIGLIADLLAINDPRVEVLQPLLSRLENSVVVRSALDFFAELDRRGEPSGPVRLIAADRIGHAPDAERYRSLPGVLALPIDWVECAAEHRPLAQRLFGGVVLVGSLPHALELADGAPESLTFLTPDGHAVESGGRMTVGAKQAAPGLISRRAEIRRLQLELEEIEVHLRQQTKHREALQRCMADEELRRDGLLQEAALVQRRQAEMRIERLRAGERVARIARESDLLERDAVELKRLIDDVQTHAAQVERERETTQAAQQQHEQQVQQIVSDLSALESSVHLAIQEHTAAQIERGRAAERVAARALAIDELVRRLEQCQAAHGSAEHELAEAIEQGTHAEREVQQSRGGCEALEVEIDRQRARVAELNERRQVLRRRHDGCAVAVRELQSRLELVDASVRDFELRLREAEIRCESLVVRVREELGIDLADRAGSAERIGRDWASVEAEIEELRGRIARLGNVNLDALSELEELTPRYEALASQRDDLVASIGQLQQLIVDLDTESKARFEKAFVEIRENFQELFRKLFGGGKADIILEQPDQPLESGIEIIARPPGKEPRSISLLSGGERTMAAVALLFAIFKSKPSPFAVLDEVDAALDESNIDRFNGMLHEFLEKTQFVVITHNKRTMQSADALYGVTMQEPGVSKRVSVRFDDRVETPLGA